MKLSFLKKFCDLILILPKFVLTGNIVFNYVSVVKIFSASLKSAFYFKAGTEQEEEFLRLNEEIDLKTKDLMSQVDRIKEVQLCSEQFHSDQSFPDPTTEIEMTEKENEKKQENHFKSDPTNKSFEDSFAFSEYLARKKDEDSLSFHNVENSNNRKTQLDLKKKQNLRLNHSTKLTPSLVTAQVHESTFGLGITKHKLDVKLKRGKLENDVIPETLKSVGHEGIMRFLSAKVKLLSEQLDVMQKDEKKHLEKIKELQAQKDKSVEEQEKLLQQANLSKNVLIKYEKHTKIIADQLQTTQIENSHLKKEVEILKKEMRQSNKNYNANEIKLNRTLEEVEKLKASLQQMKQEEKELKEIQRKKTENLTNTIKILDRQRLELLNGFKKQLLIIDNLKRQKGLIEAGQLLKSAEDDFINYLDCNSVSTLCHTNRSAK